MIIRRCTLHPRCSKAGPASRLAVLLALAALPLWAGQTSRVLRAEGKGYLEQAGGQLVLHVAGTPYEMGWQHGRLCAEGARASVRAFLHEFAVGQCRVPLRALRRRRDTLWRCVPQHIQDELHGLADGAGIAREEIDLVHVVPWFIHCSQAAAWGSATADGKLYHSRSLDYPLHIGRSVRVQDHALLIVARPAEGIPHAYASWAGFLGVVTGMNAEGISIAADTSHARERSDRGLLMPFTLKEVLRRSRSLDDALAFLRSSPRTCGYNYVVADGKIPRAVAVEVTPDQIEVLGPTDAAESTPPHQAVPDCVVRVNHFVHPATAASQRAGYDPTEFNAGSWMRHWSLSQFLIHYSGRLGAQPLVRALREHSPDAGCLHQVVFCPTDRALWLAQATNPAKGKHAGAQNQPFLRYPLDDLLAGRRIPVVADEPPPHRDVPELGICSCEDTLRPLSDPDPQVNELLAAYNFPPEPFPWRMRPAGETEKYRVYRVAFPSPRRSEMLENNTVHAEYYVPRPAPRAAPGLVVLHILDGRFLVARMICRHFAASGMPCLMVVLPYYGDRRPRGTSLADIMLDQPGLLLEAVEGGVVDVRRAACWLQQRPEVDPQRIGIMGVSLGAIAGSLVAGVDPRFSRNVLVLGGGDPAQILWHAPETAAVRLRLSELGYTLGDLRRQAKRVDPIVFAHRVDPNRVLMLNATHDKTVPKSCTVALWDAMGKPAIRWYPGGHYSLGLFVPEILPRAFQFVRDLPRKEARK